MNRCSRVDTDLYSLWGEFFQTHRDVSRTSCVYVLYFYRGVVASKVPPREARGAVAEADEKWPYRTPSHVYLLCYNSATSERVVNQPDIQ